MSSRVLFGATLVCVHVVVWDMVGRVCMVTDNPFSIAPSSAHHTAVACEMTPRRGSVAEYLSGKCAAEP